MHLPCQKTMRQQLERVLNPGYLYNKQLEQMDASEQQTFILYLCLADNVPNRSSFSNNVCGLIINRLQVTLSISLMRDVT